MELFKTGLMCITSLTFLLSICVLAERAFEESAISLVASHQKSLTRLCGIVRDWADASLVLESLANISNIADSIGPRFIAHLALIPRPGGFKLAASVVDVRSNGFAFVTGIRASYSSRPQIFVGDLAITNAFIGVAVDFSSLDGVDSYRRAEQAQPKSHFLLGFKHRLLVSGQLATENSCKLVRRLLGEIQRQRQLLASNEVLVLPPVLSCWQGGLGDYPLVQVRQFSVSDAQVYYPEVMVSTFGWVKPVIAMKTSLSIQTKQAFGYDVRMLKFGVETALVDAGGDGIADLVGGKPLQIVHDF